MHPAAANFTLLRATIRTLKCAEKTCVWINNHSAEIHQAAALAFLGGRAFKLSAFLLGSRGKSRWAPE